MRILLLMALVFAVTATQCPMAPVTDFTVTATPSMEQVGCGDILVVDLVAEELPLDLLAYSVSLHYDERAFNLVKIEEGYTAGRCAGLLHFFFPYSDPGVASADVAGFECALGGGSGSLMQVYLSPVRPGETELTITGTFRDFDNQEIPAVLVPVTVTLVCADGGGAPHARPKVEVQ